MNIRTDLRNPNYSKRRLPITDIVIHHNAGVNTVETLHNTLMRRKISANDGIGNDGTIAEYVPEEFRAWTTGTSKYGDVPDTHSVTIEVSNSAGGPDWPISSAAMKSLIWLVADIANRNNFEEMTYTGDKDGNLLTHDMYAATACPGPYLKSKMHYIASEANKLLEKWRKPKQEPTNLYRVQTTPVLTPKQADNTIQKLTRHKIEAVKVKTTDGLRVQAGAFADKKKAAAQVDRVNGLGFGFAINPEDSTEVLYKVQTNVLTKHLANKVTATLRANGLTFINLVVNNGYVVQVGAYGKLANAHKRVDTLRGLGVQTVIVTDTGEEIKPKNRATQVKEIATKIWTDSNHPYGNGAERRKTLGDLYTDVQKYIEKHFIK